MEGSTNGTSLPEAHALRKITLQSSDGEKFEVEEAVACKCGTVSQIILDVERSAAEQVIPVHNVRAGILSKIIEYCKYHVDADKKRQASSPEDEPEDDLQDDDDLFEEGNSDKDNSKALKKAGDAVDAWDKEFVKVDQQMLFELILAANYMDVKDLLKLLITTVADMIVQCKDPAEIRSKFNIENDLTPEEVEDIKHRNTWAFD